MLVRGRPRNSNKVQSQARLLAQAQARRMRLVGWPCRSRPLVFAVSQLPVVLAIAAVPLASTSGSPTPAATTPQTPQQQTVKLRRLLLCPSSRLVLVCALAQPRSLVQAFLARRCCAAACTRPRKQRPKTSCSPARVPCNPTGAPCRRLVAPSSRSIIPPCLRNRLRTRHRTLRSRRARGHARARARTRARSHGHVNSCNNCRQATATVSLGCMLPV